MEAVKAGRSVEDIETVRTIFADITKALQAHQTELIKSVETNQGKITTEFQAVYDFLFKQRRFCSVSLQQKNYFVHV